MSKFKIGDTVVTNIDFKVGYKQLEKGMKGKVLNIFEDYGIMFIETDVEDLGVFIILEDVLDLYEEKKLSDLKDLKMEEDKTVNPEEVKTEEKLNSHYDNCFRGERLDPYRVSDIWKLGKRDNTGVLFHILKTIARFGDKNSIEREIKSIYFSIKRLAEIKGIELEK